MTATLEQSEIFDSPSTSALWLAEQGFQVFPVDHPELPTCVGLHKNGICRGRGKEPASGFKKGEPTSDPKAVAATWAGSLRNVGVYCGQSLLVVDEDAAGELGCYCASIGVELPVTFTVITGKGRHYYFRVPGGLSFGNGEGALKGYKINVRSGNGYVVGPGSLHASGAVYTPEDGSVPVAVMPDWLVEALHRPQGAQEPKALDEYDGPLYEALDAAARARIDSYVKGAVEPELRRLDACKAAKVDRWWPGDVRYDGPDWDATVFEVSCKLAEWARSPGNGYTFDQAEAAVLARAPRDAGFTDAVVAHKWQHAIEHTEPKIREVPPQPEGPGLLVEVLSSAEMGPALDWATFLDEDDTDPVWLAGKLAEEGQQVALVGEAKVGKSLLSLDWAASIAGGLPFLGDASREPLSVLYVDQENPERDLRRRVRSLGYTIKQLERLHYLSFPAHHRPLDTATGAAVLLADVERYAARVVFLDTVSRMIEGNENDSETWLALYRLTLMPLKRLGVSVIRLDHFGKDTDRGARGSSAKTQDVDQVWELKKTGSKTRLSLKRTHSRTGLGDDLLNVTRMGESGVAGSTSHVRSGLLNFEPLDPGVANAVRTLAEHGCPPGLGRDKLKAWSKDHGTGLLLSNDTWSQVVNARREQ